MSTDGLAAHVWDGDVPLTRLLDRVRPAYGGETWDEALAYLREAPAENAVIEALCSSGVDGFDEPIRVIARDDEPDSCPDAPALDPHSPQSWVIGNGMHRVAASVRLGHQTIACTTSSASASEAAAQEYVDLTFTLPAMAYCADFDPDDGTDELDWASGWLRSFALPDGTWVECDSFASHGKRMTGMWICPATHADVLVEQLHARFGRFAPAGCDGSLVILSMRTLTGAEWDAEFEAEFGTDFGAGFDAGFGTEVGPGAHTAPTT